MDWASPVFQCGGTIWGLGKLEGLRAKAGHQDDKSS